MAYLLNKKTHYCNCLFLRSENKLITRYFSFERGKTAPENGCKQNIPGNWKLLTSQKRYTTENRGNSLCQNSKLCTLWVGFTQCSDCLDSLLYTGESEKQIELFLFSAGFGISPNTCRCTSFYRFIFTQVSCLICKIALFMQVGIEFIALGMAGCL